MVWPSFSAPCWRPSAAMKVCAMPVGHEVIATMFAMVVSSFLSEKDKRNSSGTFLVPPAEGGEDTSRSGRGTASPCTPCSDALRRCTTRNIGQEIDGHLLEVCLNCLGSREVVTGTGDRTKRKGRGQPGTIR